MRAGTVGFNDTPFGAASGRCRFPHGVTGEVLEGSGCKPFVFKSFGGCDEVGVNFGFHYLNRASITRRTPQFPVESPGEFRLQRSDQHPCRVGGCGQTRDRFGSQRIVGKWRMGFHRDRKRKGIRQRKLRNPRGKYSTRVSGRSQVQRWNQPKPLKGFSTLARKVFSTGECSLCDRKRRPRSRAQG